MHAVKQTVYDDGTGKATTEKTDKVLFVRGAVISDERAAELGIAEAETRSVSTAPAREKLKASIRKGPSASSATRRAASAISATDAKGTPLPAIPNPTEDK